LKTGTSSAGLGFRVRVAGADLTTSTYRIANSRQDPSSFNFNVFGGNPTSSFSGPDSKAGNTIYARFGMPFLTQNTSFLVEGDGVSYRNVRGGGYVDNTTSYTGFTVYPSSGTITGTALVYGYRK